MDFDKCQACGRRLYVEQSRKIGIGPTCLKKVLTKMELDSILARFKDVEEEAE